MREGISEGRRGPRVRDREGWGKKWGGGGRGVCAGLEGEIVKGGG